MTNRKLIDEYSASLAKAFATQLREKRLEKNLTIVDLAFKSMLTSKTISKIENGCEELPTTYTIISLSFGLDFFEWDFFTLNKI